MASRSTDGGATWSALSTLQLSNCGAGTGVGAGYDRASDPWISFAGNGIVVASSLAFAANGFFQGTTGGPSAILMARSTDGGVTWGAATKVFEDLNPGPTIFFNDRDSVTADPATGNVYLVWDRLSSDPTLSMPAYLALLTGAGATLGNVGVLYDPGPGNEAFNNQVVILPSGAVLDFFTLVASTGVTSLQFVPVVISNGTWTPSASGSAATIATFTTSGTPSPIPGGLPIRDSYLMAQAAVDPATGAVALVWQRNFSSTTFDGIALSVSTDGGAHWSVPKQVNGAAAFAAFSPTVRYLPGSVLAITYYDLRDFASGSSALNTDLWLTESSDAATWYEVRIQGPFDATKAPVTNNNRPFGIGTAYFLGDNQGLALSGSNPLPLYAATNNGGAHVYATQSPSPLNSPTAHVYTALSARR
jgi:hypothetical protein